jgi:hypothetical protein
MALLVVLGALVGAVCAYFLAGILIRWLWEWWILAFAIPIALIVGFSSGWVGAVVAIIAVCLALAANNHWHSSPWYFAGADRIDNAFYFKDT